MLHRVAVSVSVILVITMPLASPARAQVTGATLSGAVTDPSGAAIAGAQISVTNRATGVNRAVVTDSAGLYSIPNLLQRALMTAVWVKLKSEGPRLICGANQNNVVMEFEKESPKRAAESSSIDLL